MQTQGQPKKKQRKKQTTKDEMLVNPALAPINPNVRTGKLRNLAVAKAIAEAGLEITASKKTQRETTSPQEEDLHESKDDSEVVAGEQGNTEIKQRIWLARTSKEEGNEEVRQR